MIPDPEWTVHDATNPEREEAEFEFRGVLVCMTVDGGSLPWLTHWTCQLRVNDYGVIGVGDETAPTDEAKRRSLEAIPILLDALDRLRTEGLVA